MAKKKTDDVQEPAENTEAVTEETVETAEAAATEEKAEKAEAAPAEEVPAKEAKAEKVEKAKKPAKKKAAKKADKAEKPAAAEDGETVAFNKGKRMEKIGFVASDKMTKTVTVRVDRLVKHPVYRKYVRRRKKFMAHDELGSKIGDKVRIVETRPTSARKRWRVVEILQKSQS